MSFQDRQKDATYIVVSLRPTRESQPGTWIVRSMSLRDAIAKGRIVRIQGGNKTGEIAQPGEAEASDFFGRLTFKRQVSWSVRSGVFKGGRTGGPFVLKPS